MVQIKFKAFGSNSAFGGFAPGDTLRTNEGMAQHLVDLGLAIYAEAKQPNKPQPEPAEEKPAKRRKQNPTS